MKGLRFTIHYEMKGATYYMRHLTGSQVAMMKRKYYVFKVVREK